MGIQVLLLFSVVISITEANTPVTCGINEEFVIDLKRCQNTCEFYGRKWNCPANYYKPKGDCYCKDGFARITEGGKCVSVTKNQNCRAQLPISEDSCTGLNESYLEAVKMGVCDVNCLTFGCNLEYTPIHEYTWGPHCECKNSNFRRLSNGKCVEAFHEECAFEYQPSKKRCEAIGLLYKTNAPCQPACYDKTYCPSADGACVCPPDKLAFESEIWAPVTSRVYDEVTQQYSWVPAPVRVVSCYHHETHCPITTTSAAWA